VPELSVMARTAFRTASFWWLAVAFALVRLSFAAMGAHLVPLLLERGYTAAFVALKEESGAQQRAERHDEACALAVH
jgi:hypothetical protein